MRPPASLPPQDTWKKKKARFFFSSNILVGERAARGGASAPFWRLQQRHLADGRLKLAAIQIGQAVGKAKAGARGGKARGE